MNTSGRFEREAHSKQLVTFHYCVIGGKIRRVHSKSISLYRNDNG
jgi:hypothetical protein